VYINACHAEIKIQFFCDFIAFFAKMKMLKRYKYSLVILIIISYLSLKGSSDFDKVNLFHFPHIDKIVHFCMYFGFMSVIIFENFILSKRRHSIIILALIPFFFGIIMECLQGLLTTTRSADVYDAIFNTLGIFISIVCWLIIKPVYNKKFK
jgi:VanZ family protein